MAKKTTPETSSNNRNNNTNNNTNNVNVNVNVEHPRSNPEKKKEDPNWYTRTILGGIIALILSIGGYYIKKHLDDKGKRSTDIEYNTTPVEGVKQN